VGERSAEQLDGSGCGIATLEKAMARSLVPEKGVVLFFFFFEKRTDERRLIRQSA
jgi:hypothetical protein